MNVCTFPPNSSNSVLFFVSVCFSSRYASAEISKAVYIDLWGMLLFIFRWTIETKNSWHCTNTHSTMLKSNERWRYNSQTRNILQNCLRIHNEYENSMYSSDMKWFFLIVISSIWRANICVDLNLQIRSKNEQTNYVYFDSNQIINSTRKIIKKSWHKNWNKKFEINWNFLINICMNECHCMCLFMKIDAMALHIK